MSKGNRTSVLVATSICLLCAFNTAAQNKIVNGDLAIGNLTGWTVTNAAPTTVAYDLATGNPSGSALLARNNSSAAANGNYLYQIVPVVNGAQYKLSAQWKGDLLNGGTGRNWAEVYVNFTATNTTFVPGTIRYKKATDGGPNDTPMPWDWEDITASPDSSNPGPSNGVFTATGDYMTIAFNLGGRAQTSNNTQPGYYWVDNVSVTPYPPVTPVSQPVFTNAAVPSGADIVLSGTNGPANGAYEVLRSTNVGEPVGAWQGVGIQPFDANGNFSFTNPISSEVAAGFYRLLVVSSVPVFAPVITSQPQDAGIAVGQDANFNVTATGTSPLTYRWYFNTNTLVAAGSSASLTITNAHITDSGKISVTVSNLVGSAQSVFTTLTVTNNTQPPGILVQPTNHIVFVGQTANFGVTATGATPLQYQWYYNTNTVLAGRTNSTLTVPNVQLTNAGTYSVTITNLYGSTNSGFAALTVNIDVSSQLIGWASVAGYGQTTTTGGGTNAPILVTDVSTLRKLAGDSTPRVLHLSGTFVTGSSAITIANNKTLRGMGPNVVIQGGIDINTKSNIIVQNLAIQGNGVQADGTTINPPVDCAAARTSHHLWFDHVSFSDAGDGLLDITVASDLVTVSWCKFYYTDSNNGHRLVSLNSSGGGTQPGDYGKMRVTYHHNWWSTLCDQRMPRVMYGRGHQFNNYYYAPGNGYCIGFGSYASVLIESNYFKNVNDPHTFMYDVYAYAAASGNIYDNCTGDRNTGYFGSGNVSTSDHTGFVAEPFTPPYPYTLDPATNVPSIVTLGAGPQ